MQKKQFAAAYMETIMVKNLGISGTRKKSCDVSSGGAGKYNLAKGPPMMMTMMMTMMTMMMMMMMMMMLEEPMSSRYLWNVIPFIYGIW